MLSAVRQMSALRACGMHRTSPCWCRLRWAPACRKLGQNQLSGSLPGEWAGNNAFQSLTELDVSSNRLNGDLPDSYGAQGAFSGLQLLRLGSNAFTGVQTVPACAACTMSLHHHHCLGSCSGLHCCSVASASASASDALT